MKMTLEEMDQVIFHLAKKMDKRYQEVTPEQVKKIKAVWQALHLYDDKHIYTFNDDYTILRKEVKSEI